jgi:hypothetical protein
VAVAVLVDPFVGAFVGVFVAVFVGALLGVVVGVFVGVFVRVVVGVFVGVLVGVLVAVMVRVFVGVIAGVGVQAGIRTAPVALPNTGDPAPVSVPEASISSVKKCWDPAQAGAVSPTLPEQLSVPPRTTERCERGHSGDDLEAGNRRCHAARRRNRVRDDEAGDGIGRVQVLNRKRASEDASRRRQGGTALGDPDTRRGGCRSRSRSSLSRNKR